MSKPTTTKESTTVDRLKALDVKKKPASRELVKRPTALDKIFHRKNCAKSVFYFTTRGVAAVDKTKPSPTSPPVEDDVAAAVAVAADIKKTPFWFPPEEKEFSFRVVNRVWRDRYREEQRRCRYDEKPTFRTRQNLEFPERLNVPEEDLVKVPGIIDVDPEYFSVVAGRPNGDKTTMRDYRQTVRDTLITRLKTGYLQDETLKYEMNFIDEQNKIDAIRNETKEYCDTFEEYLAKDHKKSMDVLKQSEKNFKIMHGKQEAYKSLDQELGRLKSRIYILEEKWRCCKLYQNFLYEVSPLGWCPVEDEDVKREKSLVPSTVKPSSMDTMNRQMSAGSSGSVFSVDDLISMFETDFTSQRPPLLYFEEPADLLSVFEHLEVQNLSALTHREEGLASLDELQTLIINARSKLKIEMNTIEDSIADLETSIDYEEKRARGLEVMAKDLIYTLFKDIVNQEETLNLYVFIKDTYDNCVRMKESDLEIYEMMQKIEMVFEEVMLGIDSLPPEIVHRAEATVVSSSWRVMKMAVDADRKLKMVDHLIASLARTLKPPFKKVGKSLKPRSQPPAQRKIPVRPDTPLTVEQEQMLRYFTDFCAHTDDVKTYLQKVAVDRN